MPADGRKPSKWRRLWRRRLRRRPLLPFLLAATLAVDAVIVLLFVMPVEQLSFSDFAAGLLRSALAQGFLEGQLGLTAIWLAVGSGPQAVRVLAATTLSAVVGFLFAYPRTDDAVTIAGVLLALVMAQALVAKLLVSWLRRKPQRRRVSLLDLLAWTPAVAVLAMASRSVKWDIVSQLPPMFVAINFAVSAVLVGCCLAAALTVRSVKAAAGIVALLTAKVIVVLVVTDAIHGVPFGDAVGRSFFNQAMMATVLFVWLFGLREQRVVHSTGTPEHPARREGESVEPPEEQEPNLSDSKHHLRYDDAHPSVLKMHIDLTG